MPEVFLNPKLKQRLWDVLNPDGVIPDFPRGSEIRAVKCKMPIFQPAL